MRHFNTAGPMIAEQHYQIPPLSRLDLDEIELLVARLRYFVLHAPEQSGKTTALLALRDRLNAAGRYRCVYVSFEDARSAREDLGAGMRAILNAMGDEAVAALGDRSVHDIWPEILTRAGPHGALGATLRAWAAADPRPLVLLLDDIDALVGDALISVLRQLRSGYAHRPRRFPQSVLLCGVGDVRDYRIHASSGRDPVFGGSAFNVKAKSLRLPDFSDAEVRSLLGWHTAETGQRFADPALAEVWRLTQGQPWLVNALASEVCFEEAGVRDRRCEVRLHDVAAAAERLILRRQAHLDQLALKLAEPRVQRVIEPLFSGAPAVLAFSTDDLLHVRDVGLVKETDPVEIANPIYKEVIPRELTHRQQAAFRHDPAEFVGVDGRLDMDALLRAFQELFRDSADEWQQRFQYRKARRQLLLQAFVQRIVNGGGRIEREYGIGRRQVDMALIWPDRRVVVECKVLRRGLEATLREGLGTTVAHMVRWRTDEGHLVVFDRTEGKPWSEKVFRRVVEHEGRRVVVWGM